MWQAFDGLPLSSLVSPSRDGAGWCAPLLSPEDDIELILASSAQYFLHLVSSTEAFDALVDSLRTEVGLTIGREVNDHAEAAEAPIIGPIPTPLVDLPVRAVKPRQPLARFCECEGIGSLGRLRDVSEADILSVLGLRADALLAVEDCYALSGLMERLRRNESDRPADLDILDLVHEAFQRGLEAPNRERKAVEVHLYRLGLLTGKMETHRAIGALMGMTGAGTNLIEKRSLRGFNSGAFLNELVPLRVAVLACLLKNGGVVHLHDLAECLVGLIRPCAASAEVVARALVEMLPECEMSTMPELAILTHHPCLECSRTGQVLDEINALHEPVSVDAAAALVASGCSVSGNGTCPFRVASVLAVAAAATVRSQGPVLRSEWLVPVGMGGYRADALVHVVEGVLRREARPMHFTEVHGVLAQETGRSDSARNIHACLDRSPRCALWDRGTYIHKDHMPFPYSLVREAEDWIQRGLSEVTGLPMMSVHGVYKHFRAAFEAEAVPSESALYSLLRESAEAELVFPRYPRIFLARGYTGSVPVSVSIGEYLRAAGRPVSVKELRTFVVERMGFKEFQLSQALIAGIPGALRTKHGAVVHEDYVDYDAAVLDKCIELGARLLENESNVSVRRIFSDLRVDCLLSRIDSPELLFSLLRLHAADAVGTGHYPLLVCPDQSAPSSLSMFESVEEYVRSKGGPCTFQELEEEFVEKRKYGAQTVFAVAHRHHVHRYLPASVIHEDSLGLDARSVRDLHRVAARRCADDFGAGRRFSTALDLLEEGRLPPLPEGIVWTTQLVASMLQRSGGFALLGNSRNAFVALPNALGIETFGDLVSVLVREDYGGGVNLEVLESRLREEGVILRQLTAAMLDDNPSVAISGMEIIAAEVTLA